MKLVKTQQLTRSGANRNPILMACLLFCATTAWKPAQASDYWWGCADDYWQNISCWIPRGGSSTPTSTDNVYVDLGSSGYMTLRIDSATGNAYAYSLYAMSSGPSITIEQSGGNLATYSESILENSTFNQSGGTNTAEMLFVTAGGYDGSSGGSYALSGGSLTTMGTIIDYGGSFAHTDGTHTVEILHLGHSSNDGWDGGTYTLDVTGSLSASFEHIGPTSSFIQNNGTNTVSNRLTVGEASFGVVGSANGSYTLNGGNLSTFDEYIGDVGTGSFIQSGGTHTVSNNLVLGNYGGNGSYTLNGGSLSTFDEYIGASSGTGGGDGSFTQSSGTHTISNNLILGGGGNGSYTLNGGSLSALIEFIGDGGKFTQTGGTHTVTGLVLGYSPEPATGSSIYTLEGTGSLFAFNEDIGSAGTGSFIQHNGTNTVSHRLTVGYGLFGMAGSANGNYTLNGGSLSTFDEYIGFFSGNGSFIQNGGTHTVTNTLVLGEVGGNGNYQMSAGDLSIATNEWIGERGNGNFVQSGGTHSVAMDLYIGHYANGSYELSGSGNLSAFTEFLGYGSNATFTQTGGTNTVTGTLAVGYGNNGSYSLGGGTLTSGQQFIGYGGKGNFIHNAGSNTTSQLALGWDFWAEGSYQLGGTGNLTVTQGDELIGANGKGAFTQSGGTHSVNNNIILGHNYGSSGIYNLSGGSVSAGILYVAYGGSASFTQDGGTVAIAGLAMGISDGRHNQYEDIPASNGIYHLNHGFLTTGFETIGNSGVGTFNQNGGTNTVTNNIQLGWNATGAGTYNLGAGSLSAANVYVSNAGVGVFNQTGGTSNIANRLYLGASGGTGSYNLNAGTLSIADEYIGNYSTGTFTQTGGTHSVSGTIQLAAASIIYGYPNSGTFNLAGGKLDATNIVVNNGGAFNFTGGTLAVGHFTGNLLNNGGTLAPGHSPGVTTITGNYTQSALGSYAVEIGGLLAGSEHDLLSISGSASLAGSLNVSLIDLGSGLFAPQVGDTFDILTAETITGAFDILSFANLINPSLSWHIDYLTDAIGTTDVVRLSVVASAVPLPAAAWLLGSGLLGLIGFGRRQGS